ncbi:MAG: AI-2E family transporter [Rubricella sp.]
MALSAREQIMWWTGAFLVFGFLLWIVNDTLLPFVAGAAMAYFLDPVADRLERRGFSRVWATVVITAGIVLLMIGTLLILIPLMIDQIRGLTEAFPGYSEALRNWLGERFPDLFEEGTPLRNALASATDTIRERAAGLIQTVLAGGLAIVDFIVLLVVTPVVAFYLLLDWDHMVERIDGWLPRQHADTIRSVAGEIDRVLAGFVRGQLTVCVILGTFYAVALTVVGLQFGLVIGLFAGLISFIPFVGAILGGLLSLGVALFQFWGDWVWIAAVAGVFAVGQAVEGNILTPKLVGGSVGLHPVWLIFALSAFGSLFGFTGMLIAVPVAASIGVMARFGVRQYLQSKLYRGPDTGA